MKLFFAALAAIAFVGSAHAQVHRCTDAAGKTSFSDVPCPTTAKSALQVLGRSATDTPTDPYAAQRNLESIENASRILREPTSDAVGNAGAGIIPSDPNQRIREQDERNMQRRTAQLNEEQGRREERAARAEEARQRMVANGPRNISACDRTGCWDTSGARYNRTGTDGRTLWRADGKFCRADRNTISCN
ncbi:DUF4124 domain-containing protein [Variovorax sp. H27-G14]|uniref:DUF4124 domain-containing protein n=1 Tax=Variovorax sp. H27-G14 TaxID=3111914 RepID=UPI0038FD3EB2